MKRFYFFSTVLFTTILSLSIFGPLKTTQAAIVGLGDVSPSLPWTNVFTFGEVGSNGPGSLTINNGSTLNVFVCAIGGESTTSDGTLIVTGDGSTLNCAMLSVGGAGNANMQILDGGVVNSSISSLGTTATGAVASATIDGANSQWNCDGDLTISSFGTTTLNIFNGGTVTVNGTTSFENELGTTSTLNFGTNGGTFTTNSLQVSSDQLTGTGTINTHALSSDFDVVFDSSTGLSIQYVYNSLPNQNVTVNWDMSDPAFLEKVELLVGYEGTSSLTLRDGLVLSPGWGCYIGKADGTTGTVNIESGSTLNATVTVGEKGNGTLNISGGGTVNGQKGYIGRNSGSVGTVTVDGAGSTLNLTGDLSIGLQGQATVNVTNGGSLSTQACTISEYGSGTSVVTIDGAGSTWTGGTISVGLRGSGTLNITGGAAVTHGTVNIGTRAGSTGLVNVDGSIWNVNGDLCVGSTNANDTDTGNATIIINQGIVAVAKTMYVTPNNDSTGTVQFGANTGILSTNMLWAGTGDLTGTGMINTKGIASNVDIVFDSTQGAVSTFIVNQNANQNITVNLDMSSATDPQTLAIGYRGNGSLAVRDGVAIHVDEFHLGHGSGSNATAIIDGAGSSAHCTGAIYVGNSGSGTLVVTNGARITQDVHSAKKNHIGGSESTGSVTVNGQGSEIQFDSDFYLQANGSLHILNGGTVNAICARINDETSLLQISGPGSTLNAEGLAHAKGTVNITNGGTLNNTYYDCRIGNSSEPGTVTVDGIGSTLNIQYRSLYVSGEGNGTLNIQNGGVVNVYEVAYVAKEVGEMGTIHFDNGTLNAAELEATASDLTGTGTINVKGWISDVDIQFDQNHGTSQAILLNQHTNQNVTINLDLSNNDGVGRFGVGYKGEASLTITDGVQLNTASGFLGYHAGSKGTATVTGAGSKWDSSMETSWWHGTPIFAVGYYGEGHLAITNGGTVSELTHIGYEQGSTGSVLVDGVGSKIENTRLITIGKSGNGSLEVRNGAVVNTGGLTIQTDGNTPSWVIIDGPGTTWNSTGEMSIMGSYASSLYVTNGGTLLTSSSGIGCFRKMAKIVIDGQDSSWTCNGGLRIGNTSARDGIVYVTNGATLNSMATTSYQDNYLGADFSAEGVVIVDGVGSTWNNVSRTLYLGSGWQSCGFLHISGGAKVTSTKTVIEEDSVLSITVGDMSSFTVDGALTNNGTIRLMAGAAIPYLGLGYCPIDATEEDGSGTYQALGGTWNESGHYFSVSERELRLTGQNVNLDLTQKQRLMLVDAATGQVLGASFDPNSTTTEGGSTITFTASRTDLTTQGELAALLDDNESILDSWDITTNLADGELAYLSMEVGLGWENMTVWHYDGTDWTEYEMPDYTILSYDGTYANFLVDGFSSYAITGTAVPEPSTVVLLFAGLLTVGLLPGLRKRMRKTQ